MHPDLNSGSESSAAEAPQSEGQAGERKASGVTDYTHISVPDSAALSAKLAAGIQQMKQHLKEQDAATAALLGVTPVSGGALRFNQGKPAFSAFPLDLCEGAARVMAKGRIKYAKGNYRKGYTTPEEPLDSLIRHVGALQRALEADDTDGSKGYLFDESGEAHIHHVVTSAVLLIQTMRLLGWDVEKSVPRAFKLPDGRVLPDVGQDVPEDSTLFINGIRQDGEKEKK